jgi:hypothetical protein
LAKNSKTKCFCGAGAAAPEPPEVNVWRGFDFRGRLCVMLAHCWAEHTRGRPGKFLSSVGACTGALVGLLVSIPFCLTLSADANHVVLARALNAVESAHADRCFSMQGLGLTLNPLESRM